MVPPANKSESEIRREVAELIQLGPRRGVGVLCQRAGPTLRPTEKSDFELIVNALIAEGTVWSSELTARAERRKRCGRDAREVIERCLGADRPVLGKNERVRPADVFRQTRVPRSSATLSIENQDQLGLGPASTFLLAQLHTILLQKETPVELTIRLNCDHVYIHGIGWLAAWCERFASSVRLEASASRVEYYLDRTGLRRVIEDQVSLKETQWDTQNHVALTRIDREDQAAADEVAHRLVELVAHHMALSVAWRNPLVTTFAELIENVYRHAQSNVGAYVLAQAYPNTRCLHVEVVDTGIGIYDSFRASKDENVKRRAVSEKVAIELALEKLVTSKTERHSGYGLYVVRRLIENNGGMMRVISGRQTVDIGQTAYLIGRPRTHRSLAEHLPWKGTSISLMFKLDAPLSLQSIYKELGSTDRVEDFFD